MRERTKEATLHKFGRSLGSANTCGFEQGGEGFLKSVVTFAQAALNKLVDVSDVLFIFLLSWGLEEGRRRREEGRSFNGVREGGGKAQGAGVFSQGDEGVLARQGFWGLEVPTKKRFMISLTICRGHFGLSARSAKNLRTGRQSAFSRVSTHL